MEEEIIQPIDRELLKSELTPDKQLRMTNKSHNEIYIVTANDSPNVLKEIGRLREIAFREAGGGTGKSMDLDEFDFGDNCYKQLIVWNPEADEIIGGYRYHLGRDWQLDEKGQPKLATSHMFHFSDKFLKEYMPYTVELGRSFVSLEYQNVRTNTKSIFALDNLWDGLGALTVLYPEVKYFFGKMTMYPSYIRRGRDMILYFLKKHFDDKENLVLPMKPLKLDTPESDLAAIFTEDDFKADYRILNREVRKLGYNIPPLVNAYMSLSPTMKLFGTAINYGFGDVEETGILIAIDEILENPDLAIAALTQLKEERERRKQLECQTLIQRQQIAEMQPKASYYDLILQNKNTVSITQIAMREFHLTSMHSTPMVIRVLLVVLATFRRLETENPLVVAALQLMISAQRKMTISYLNLNQPFNFRQAV